MKYSEIAKNTTEIPTRRNWVDEVSALKIDDVLEIPLKSIPHIKRVLKESDVALKFYADKEKGIGYIRRVA